MSTATGNVTAEERETSTVSFAPERPSLASRLGMVNRDRAETDTDSGGEYEVIEYEPEDQAAFEELVAGIEPAIEDDSPAAIALKANAGVKVSTLGKAARAVNLQVVSKSLKRATGVSKAGNRRGKPPRLLEDDLTSGHDEGLEMQYQEDTLLPVEESQAEDLEPVSDSIYREDVTESVIPDEVVAATADAGKKVLDQTDPHDYLKMLRWKRKKKGHDDSKHRKSYVKGKVIDGEHELYTLSIAVMIGVRTSISRTNPRLHSGPNKRWVTIQDFRNTEKYEFRPKGDAKTPGHRLAHTFKFKDYAPIAFAYLRRMYGVNEFDFLLSVCGNANFIEFISNAKSGQFFFYSSDGKYMIKTMTNSESRFLRRILPQYFKHCAENPNTMITRFFGMYRVKLYHLRRNVKFVVMNSVYYTDKYLQSFYDLKGSIIGRTASPGQSVLKDNDMRKGLPESALALHPEIRERAISQVQDDSSFLQDCGVMDYSMLVGVHHIPVAEERDALTGFRVAATRDATRARRPSAEVQQEAAVRQEALHAADHPSQRPHLHESKNHDQQGLRSSHTRKLSSGAYDHMGAFFLDDGLDDDESEWLIGSDRRPYVNHPSFSEDVEKKKLQTIEKMFWPFHRLFDIHGNRLKLPNMCPTCKLAPCKCKDDSSLLEGYNIPDFVAPLSDRKDRGFVMDTEGLSMPRTLRTPAGLLHYEGKIFYMGIIDILQEYNVRKRVESRYRLLKTGGDLVASCIPPEPYAVRFVNFFKEYSHREREIEIGVEVDVSGPLLNHSSAK